MNHSLQGSDEIRSILAAIDEINEFLIISEFNLDEVLDVILKKALELSEGKYGQILLYNGQDLVIAATTGSVEKGVRLAQDRCVCGIVVERKESLIIDDVDKEERFHRFFDDAKSELAVPLIAKNKVLGVLNIESPKPGAFTPHHRDLLQTLSLQAAHAIKIATMYDQQKALAEIDKTLARASAEKEAVYELIVKKSLNLIGGRSGQLLLMEGDELVIAATTGPEKPMVTRVHIDSCISGMAVKSRKPVNIGDITLNEYSTLYKSYLGTMKSELVIPLIEKDQVIGVLNFENPLPDFFDDDHVRILKHMADHATVAIRNLQIYQSFRMRIDEAQQIIKELEDIPEKMKKAVSGFNKITRFFEEKEAFSPSLFPPTGDY
ncbi:MAG: GAF domain-containing protein [Candidatus Xenobiia bacterium LiM19]